MPTKPTQLRIPPELLERLDRHAEQTGSTRTAVILEAVERHLKAARGRAVQEAPKTASWDEVAQSSPPSASGRYACPMYGCDYEAASQAARCPVHGRTVIPN